MGQLTIQFAGSFRTKNGQKMFNTTALEGGHAAAIGRAIQFLSDQLPEAIAQDHALHDEGQRPPAADFGKSK